MFDSSCLIYEFLSDYRDCVKRLKNAQQKKVVYRNAI